MSLVAYGSSDESDQSDVEDNNRDDKSSASITDNDTGALVKHPKHLAQPSPRDKLTNDDQFSDSDTEQGDNVNQNTLDDKLKELPVPKAVDSGGIVENDALEDLVKPKPSQVADIEKPAPKKLRQPVKITIPALPDSDDESDQPAKKKPRPGIGSGKSGLTSILPAPVHAAKKETGRILLPYSLTKKTQSATSGASAVKKTNHTTSQSSDTSQKLSASLASYGSDSDDDDETGEPVSFFSLDSSGSNSKLDSIAKSKTDTSADSSKQMIGPSLGPMQMDNTDLNTGIPTVPLPPSSSRTSLNLPAPSRSENSSVDEHVLGPSSSDSAIGSLATGTSIDPNAPLTFKGGVSSQRTYGGLYNSNSAMSSSTSSSSSGIPSAEGDPNMFYNMPYDGSVHYPESTDVEAFKQDNEFLRLQGRTKRGKEEINLIDVNADDFTDPSEIAKHLSEEQTYQSHRKKDNQPSGQQKRKHQIHYLAFQAKERELELKNQWSQSRQTKKQTQAKYGF